MENWTLLAAFNASLEFANETVFGSSCTYSIADITSECFRVLVYFVYTLVFLASLVGNSIVCCIVFGTPRMRTVTNYFIANLAIGDMLITLLCVPLTSISQVEYHWPFYGFLCPVISYVQTVSVFVSAYTLVAISVDRYVAIMWPLKPRLSKRATTCIIAGVWFFASVSVLPTYMVSELVQPELWYKVCDKFVCQEDWTSINANYAAQYSRYLLLLQFVIPVSVLLFTYTSIGIVIWCHRIPGEAENCRDQRIAKSKRKMIKMMFIVVLVYTICWLPFNIYWCLELDISRELQTYYWFAVHSLAMSHACYTPIIYCYMNNRFRQGFAQIFGLIPCCSSIHRNTTDGRSRMSVPLTSVAGIDSTILHRNNTCMTYISTRRRNGSSVVLQTSGSSRRMDEPSGQRSDFELRNLSASMQMKRRCGNGHTSAVNFKDNLLAKEDV